MTEDRDDKDPDLSKEGSIDDRKLDLAWRIYLANVGFATHFDLKPTGLIAMATVLVLAVGSRLSSLELVKLKVEHFGWNWMMETEAIFLFAFAITIFTSFLFLIASFSPTACASFLTRFPWIRGKEQRRKRGVIFFDDIASDSTVGKWPSAQINYRPWMARFAAATEQDILDDIADQVVENAVIASHKARLLRRAAILLMLCLSFAFVLLVILPVLHAWFPNVPGLF